MTDNEIIKALECCIHQQLCAFDDGKCSYFDKSYVGRQLVIQNAYDLIKRQQAEIDKYEQIKTTLNEFWDILLKFKIAKRKEKPTLEEFAEAIGHIQDEAVKEFAEWLFSLFPKDKRFTTISRSAIKQKLNEMVGEMND